MLKILYYNWRNLVYYRQEQLIDRRRMTNIAAGGRRAITDAVLATVGLKTVDGDKNQLPWYILLSKIQKSWVSQANEHGFKVGLL